MSVVSGASGSASYYTGADGATSAYGDATLAGGASVSGYTRASNAAAAAYQEEVTGWAAVRQKLGQLKKKWKSKGEPQKKYTPHQVNPALLDRMGMPQTATGSGGAGSAPAESGDQYGQGGAASEDDSTIEEEEEVNPWSVVLPDGDIIDPPEDHPDPQVWHNHVKLLVKARFMPEHADHYSIKVQKDLEEVSRRRLPKFPRATALFGEFEPLPKDEVYALIVEQVARPRGWGMPCHHGDDQEPHLKIRPKGWSPSPIAVHNSGYQDTIEWRIEDRWDRREDRLWRIKQDARKEIRRFLPYKEREEDSEEEEEVFDSASAHRPKQEEEAGAYDRIMKKRKPKLGKRVLRGQKRTFKFREKLFNEAVEMASVEDTAKFEGHDFIKMKEPPANAVLEKGKSYQIEWICRDPEVQDVVIKLFSRDHMVTTISESHINNGFMLWTVPHWLPDGVHYRIKVEDIEDAGNFAFSQPFFKISLPPEVLKREERHKKEVEEKRRQYQILLTAEKLGTSDLARAEAALDEKLAKEEAAKMVKDRGTASESMIVKDADQFQNYQGKRNKYGQPHGKDAGRWDFAVGGFYQGDFKEGRRHGRGLTEMHLGPVYKGGFEDDKFSGPGEITLLNGARYTGEWKNGKRHGKGTLTYPQGRVYIGEFENGLPHGFGTMKTAAGMVYEGRFKEGKCAGLGKLKFELTGEEFEEVWEPKPFASLIRFVRRRQVKELRASNERHKRLHGVREAIEFQEYIERVREHNREVAEKEALEARLELLRQRKINAAQGKRGAKGLGGR